MWCGVVWCGVSQPDPLRATPPSAGPPSTRPPLRRTTQNFALSFSLSRSHFQFFLSLGMFSCLFFSLRVVSSCVFLVVFWSVGTSNVLVFALGLSPAALGPPGLHTTARELQTRTFQGPCASTKIQRKDPTEREERKKIVAGEGTKSAKFWALHPSGPHPFGGPTLRGPTLSRFGLVFGPERPVHCLTLRRHVGPKRHWPKQVRPKQVKLA